MEREDSLKQTPYGIGYGFFLAEDLIGNVQQKGETLYKNYVKEYLFITEYFQEQASQHGLEVVSHETFDEYFQNNVRDNESNPFKKGKCQAGEKGVYFNEDLWECIRLYKVFIV